MRPENMVGQTLGHYHLLRIIGYGGAATVFLAQDIHLQREVAVKVFWPRPGETSDFLRRFAREARVLAQLDHPNILPVYDYGEQEHHAFLVMPYMAGGSLKDLLKARKVLPPAEAIRLITQIMNGLQYAHERGLIHRDIKPGNMLFKAGGTLLLADFGLVKVLSTGGESSPALSEETASQTGPSIAGTPEYMSPEQINGQATLSSDIYSVGVVLYEMLTGSRPFSATSAMKVLMRHLHEQPGPLRELNPQISPQLESVVLRALAKDSARRYSRPADFLQALTWAASFEGTAAPNSGPGPQRPINASAAFSNNKPGYEAHGETLIQASQAAPITPAFPITPAPSTVQSGIKRAAPITTPPGNTLQAYPVTRRSRSLPIVLVAILLLVLTSTVATLAFSPLRQTLFGAHIASTPGPTITATAGLAHGSTPSTTNNNTPGVTSLGNGNPTPGTGGSTTTVAVPTTSTSCPADGTARAAITAPLKLGQNANIVYLVNEGTPDAPTFGTVKRYDTVTGNKVEVAKMSNTHIYEAQVSADGQWVLFTASVSGQYQLRMVRMDGQGLQTLFCASPGNHISGTQWAVTQQLVIFDEGSDVGAPTMYLLNIVDGTIQKELLPPSSGIAFMPRTWLDRTRVLLTGFVPNSDAPPQNVYILDTKKGANQQNTDLQQIVTISQQCWDFDSSWDTKELFLAQCTPGQHGSGILSVQPITGSTQSTILNSSTLAFASVRAIDRTNTNLLILVSNMGLGVSGDTSQDGLWKVKTDGSGLTRLTTDSTGASSTLNSFSQYTWSNVSRDGTMYALQTTNSSSNTYTLLFGTLNSNSQTTFASISGTALAIAGWTTL